MERGRTVVVDSRARNLVDLAGTGRLKAKAELVGALGAVDICGDNLVGTNDNDGLVGGNETTDTSASKIANGLDQISGGR